MMSHAHVFELEAELKKQREIWNRVLNLARIHMKECSATHNAIVSEALNATQSITKALRDGSDARSGR